MKAKCISVYLTEQELTSVREACANQFSPLACSLLSVSAMVGVCALEGAKALAERVRASRLCLPPSGHGPELPPGSEGIPMACCLCGQYYRPTDAGACSECCPKCVKQLADDLPY